LIKGEYFDADRPMAKTKGLVELLYIWLLCMGPT